MKKLLAVLLIVWGAFSMINGISSSGGDESKIAAHVGVNVMLIALGAWLWGKKASKTQTE